MFYLNRDTKGWPSHSDSEYIPMIPVLCSMQDASICVQLFTKSWD